MKQDSTAQSLNPLCLPVLKIINGADESLSEYDIIKALGDHAFPDDVSEDAQLTLFRRHFYLMNALYQLQEKLQCEGLHLHISAMQIYIRPLDKRAATALSSHSADEKLSAYYLDWHNYDSTSSQDVDALLHGFWKQYRQYHQQLPSLKTLELDEKASWQDIQQSYRRLVNIHHPDKGGERQRFMEIRAAYESLQAVYDV